MVLPANLARIRMTVSACVRCKFIGGLHCRKEICESHLPVAHANALTPPFLRFTASIELFPVLIEFFPTATISSSHSSFLRKLRLLGRYIFTNAELFITILSALFTHIRLNAPQRHTALDNHPAVQFGVIPLHHVDLVDERLAHLLSPFTAGLPCRPCAFNVVNYGSTRTTTHNHWK